MGHLLTILISICLFTAAPAWAVPALQFEHQGAWVSASAVIEAPLPMVSLLITDVTRYNDLLPSFMHGQPVDGGSGERRLSMRVDLPWPCRDIRATFVDVAAGEGIQHWEYVEGNLEGGSLELSARREGAGTRLSCLIYVQLPHWCPDWVLGVMARRVLRHVMQEIDRRAVADSRRLLTATAAVGRNGHGASR